jgi:hypothetical protein
MNAIKLTLLAAAGVALLAAAPASAQTTARHATRLSAKHVRAHAYPGGVYLLENRGAGYGGAAGNTNAAEDFQSQFNVDY